MPTLTADARAIWQCGVDAANASRLVSQQVMVLDDVLQVGEKRLPLSHIHRICIVGGGKAATAMARGLLESLTSVSSRHGIRIFGQINVPQTHTLESGLLDVRQVRPLSINLPTVAAVAATGDMMETAASLGKGDLCIALISGGGSALLVKPVNGISLDDKIAATRILSERGAGIAELNQMRQCLSDVKAGGLANCCQAGTMVALVLSDVIGDPLSVIASGPMIGVTKHYKQVLDMLTDLDTGKQIPESVYNHLKKHISNTTTPTTRRVDHTIIGNNQTAVDAAAKYAGGLGYHVVAEVATPPEILQEKARELTSLLAASRVKTCIVSGGEPTFQLAPRDQRGQGGRNQQLALTALRYWQLEPNSDQRSFCLLSGGTDGEDGTTSVAGAWCDNATLSRIRSLDLRIDEYLEANDTGNFFRQTGSQLSVPVTDTNVCDLRVFVCE